MALGHVQAQDATEYFDGNAYNVLLSAKGNHFWDYNQMRMYVPSAPGDTTGPGTIFTSTLWIGGIDQAGQLHLAAERFLQTGRDFDAGPFAEVYDSTDAQYNRLWKINKSELSQWLVDPAAQIPPQVVQDWPGNGRNFSPYNESAYLAPFVDTDNDGQYNPTNGFDYPKMRGDQSVYFMFNDNKSLNTESGGAQMGIEVRGMAYGFNCPEDSALNQTLFMHYEITNRSGNDYDEVYLGLWNDFDIGNSQDDFIGCDPLRNLFFGYNADDFDEDQNGITGYGDNVAAQGVKILSGIFMDNDGADNQPGVEQGEYVNGFGFDDGIVDNEKIGLSYFVQSGAIVGPTTEPAIAVDYYNQMIGNGVFGPITHPSNGQPTRFMFPGNSDTLFFGTYGDTVAPWSMGDSVSGGLAGDQRALGSMGPFSMPPNKTISFDIAYVFAQSEAGSMVAVQKMKNYADNIQELFDSGMTPCGAFEPEFALGVENITAENVWKLYPNPTTGLVTITSSNNAAFKTQIFNAQGELVANFASSNTTQKVDLSNLSRGVYFVKTASERFSQTQKLILQ